MKKKKIQPLKKSDKHQHVKPGTLTYALYGNVDDPMTLDPLDHERIRKGVSIKFPILKAE